MNYLDDLGARIRGTVPQEKLPAGNSESLFRLYAVLLLAKGPNVTDADVHNAWVAWMTAIDPEHESLVPFSALTPTVALADKPYVDAIVQVALQTESEGHDRLKH